LQNRKNFCPAASKILLIISQFSILTKLALTKFLAVMLSLTYCLKTVFLMSWSWNLFTQLQLKGFPKTTYCFTKSDVILDNPCQILSYDQQWKVKTFIL